MPLSSLAPVGPMTHAPPEVPGSFAVVGQSGVPAMAAVLLQNGRVVFLDKVANYTQVKLDNGHYAYSAEYDPATNEVVGLELKVRQGPAMLDLLPLLIL
jgi:hypothetical protein